MAHDQVHKQLNPVVKGDSGIVGITENNDVLKNANSTLQQEKLKLEQELDTRSSMCTELGTKLSGKESRLSDMQSVISATEQKVDEMRKAIEAAKGKEEVLLSTIEENKKNPEYKVTRNPQSNRRTVHQFKERFESDNKNNVKRERYIPEIKKAR